MINVAILGTGKIIPEAVGAMQASKKFHVATIWARPHSRDKADALAERFNIDKFTTNLDDIINDATIDFVYVGLVNSVHHEYAKKFLAAGKNVILEKPFTIDAAQAEDLINLASLSVRGGHEFTHAEFLCHARRSVEDWSRQACHVQLFAVFQPLRRLSRQSHRCAGIRPEMFRRRAY